MTSKGNRFGIGPVDGPAAMPRRERAPGPMGTAVRESAASAQESSEALVEQRRLNAVEAREYRSAREQGRVLVSIPLDEIGTDALPRDRLDLGSAARSDEMDELKASIRERGQREPVEVFQDAAGAFQLKAGWRRLTALRQLFAETNDPQFGAVTARVTAAGDDRAGLYVDMVEENVIRQDLSFAEMAQIAIELSRDPQAGIADADEAVTRLFRSLHKVKRAYIRSFASLLLALGGALKFPRALSRDLGVEIARRIAEADSAQVASLASVLSACEDEAAQAQALRAFLDNRPAFAGRGALGAGRQKFEFHVGDSKVTARKGELRIKAGIDFASVEREVLDRAIRSFHAVLSGKG